MTQALIDDCFRPSQPRLLHEEALSLLRDRVVPVVGHDTMPVSQAARRVVAETVTAFFPVPAHTNSAVDGYAFDAAHYVRDRATEFRLVAGRSAAGHALLSPVPAGPCLPCPHRRPDAGGDEHGRDAGGRGPRGTGIGRHSGRLEAARERSTGGRGCASRHHFVRAGHRLRPQDLAALASIGRVSVDCFRRLRVAVVSTGDEIRRPDGVTPLALGQVFDANAPMLVALASQTGVEVEDLGVWPDTLDEVSARLAQAARDYDVILTSGGASLGDEDHMSAALARLGQRHFWQIAIKPGRPMMLGQIGHCSIVGLPGNPVAVFVCYLMYVHPMLVRLGGGPWVEPRRWLLPAAFTFAGRKVGRREFWRASLIEQDGQLAVEKFRRDGSGLISGLRAADGLIDIPEQAGDVSPGDRVAFIPFSEFGIG